MFSNYKHLFLVQFIVAPIVTGNNILPSAPLHVQVCNYATCNRLQNRKQLLESLNTQCLLSFFYKKILFHHVNLNNRKQVK